MSRKLSSHFLIEKESPKECELCGARAECRPYGPNGEQICFPCGREDMETTMKKFLERVDGPSELDG